MAKTWRDHVGPATFRGASFFVDSNERAGGRRTVKHEYPLRDAPFYEDMGLKVRAFSIEGHVIGADYMDRRDALIAALETSGPGELVHPLYGSRRVICTNFRIRESTDAGGVAHFTIDFESTSATPEQPTAVIDPIGRVAGSAAGALAGSQAAFKAAYNVVGQPQSALASLSAMLASASAALDTALAPLISGTQELALFKSQLTVLTSQAVSLARKPDDIVTALVDTVAALTQEVVSSAVRLIPALLSAYSFAPSIARPPATTSTRVTEQANYDALQRLIQQVLIVQAAVLSPTLTYDSYEDAVTSRNAVADKLDEQIDLAPDDNYPNMLQLRSDLVKAVPGDDSDLAHLVKFTPGYQVPSLVLAHRLYGDVSLEADLVARNHLPRPGFIPGGVQLEVLSSA